jgi:hypothetical protein
LHYLDAALRVGRRGPVAFPRELLSMGVELLSRGLLTTLVVDHNQDWLLPYWLRRQLDPDDPGYVPRALNQFLGNQSYRNWTAVGALDSDREVVVDPRGLVTPWFNGWSLDHYLEVGGERHAAAEMGEYLQEGEEAFPLIRGSFSAGGLTLVSEVWVDDFAGQEQVVVSFRVRAEAPVADVRLAIALRPFNPEGVSLLHQVAARGAIWEVEGRPAIAFDRPPDGRRLSTFRLGDAACGAGYEDVAELRCGNGLLTAVAFFDLDLISSRESRVLVTATVRPEDRVIEFARGLVRLEGRPGPSAVRRDEWREALGRGMRLRLPDEDLQRSFERHRLYLLLLDDGEEIHPGPFTYHHHWFRDSAYLIAALTRLGFHDRARRKLETWPERQERDGYFLSQRGEWDSNGQAIWTILDHYRHTRDAAFLGHCYDAIFRGARWIRQMRRSAAHYPDAPRGLLPAGFSAEHFGPNDYYLWDNFWAMAGLREAAMAAEALGEPSTARWLRHELDDYRRSVSDVLEEVRARQGNRILPPSPYRRPGPASVGALAAWYPLELYPSADPWLRETVSYLLREHVHHGGFFHSLTHSGVNVYLTCHLAQCLLLLGDDRAHRLARDLLALASPTLTWPEALHPLTGEGCMGDGMHGWASADWLLLLRAMVLQEFRGALVLTPALPRQWLRSGARIDVAGAPTRFGRLDFQIILDERELQLEIETQLHRPPEKLLWALPAVPERLVIDGAEQRASGAVVTLPRNARRVEVVLPRPAPEDA